MFLRVAQRRNLLSLQEATEASDASFRPAAGKTVGMALFHKSNDCMNHLRPLPTTYNCHFLSLMKNSSKQDKQHNVSKLAG